MLERSRTSPLRINIFTTASEATCTAVLTHMGRIETLIIEHSQQILEHFQCTLLTWAQQAPLLKTLEITQESAYDDDMFRLSTSIISQIPFLKTLWLADIDFDWMIFPLRNLTKLSLVCLELSKDPSWKDFYNVLRQMPSLEDLSFRFDDLQLILPPHQGFEPLQLPLLHTLVINESRASVTRSFLSNTYLPRLRNTYLECSCMEHPELAEYSTTVDAILPLVIKGSFGCLDLLSISDSSFAMSRRSNPVRNWAARHAIDFVSVAWPNLSMIGRGRALMAGLAALSTQPASRVVCLSLSVQLTSEQYLELFGHLPQLESVVGKYISSRPIIESLKISPVHSPDVPIPFPKLTSLELYGQPHEGDYTPELLLELCNCLMERHRYGASMAELSLCWDLTQEEAERLAEYVADVECGEIVG